jgi:phosphoenolpyruvate carboxykinase (GTP)
MGDRLNPARMPAIFQVNWFRKGADGRFLWPGFGENSRVVAWITEQVDAAHRAGAAAGAVDSPLGLVPAPGALDVDGLDLPAADLAELFHVDRAAWRHEADLTEAFFTELGHVPARVRAQLDALRERLRS